LPLKPAQKGRDDHSRLTHFDELGLPSSLVELLARGGINRPFPIQAAVIGDALAGRDICGRAPTGSGKTLAFGLPLLARVGRARPGRPRALVLAPTRELAEQICRALAPLARESQRWIAAIYGGVGMEQQRRQLRKGVDVLVACPGRLADLIRQGDVSLADVDIVVVDEADRMSDMGFLPEVRKLLDQTAPNRQTLLFSATLDGEVAVLTRDYQKHPVRHTVGNAEPNIVDARHHFWRVEPPERLKRLAEMASSAGRTVVFCKTRHGVDRVARQLNSLGVNAAAIHGGRNQRQRDRALADFTRGAVDVLVATDVAARGIHVDGIACVVHFDLPADAKTYLHRSGRTARAGARGSVVSFVSQDQVRNTMRMQRSLGLDVAIGKPVSIAARSGR
jgi:superfamily II DNA/RNA helicase